MMSSVLLAHIDLGLAALQSLGVIPQDPPAPRLKREREEIIDLTGPDVSLKRERRQTVIDLTGRDACYNTGTGSGFKREGKNEKRFKIEDKKVDKKVLKVED